MDFNVLRPLCTFDFQFYLAISFSFSLFSPGKEKMLAKGFDPSLLRMLNTHLTIGPLIILVTYFLQIYVPVQGN